LEPTVTVCAAGALPPAVAVKFSEFVLNVIDPEVTVNVTGIVTGLLATPAVVTVTVTVPVYVPAERSCGVTVRPRLLGVVPEI
jgi:hypothetical protein